MKFRIITMFLLMAILGLLLPLTQEYLAVDKAFTIHNLVCLQTPVE